MATKVDLHHDGAELCFAQIGARKFVVAKLVEREGEERFPYFLCEDGSFSTKFPHHCYPTVDEAYEAGYKISDECKLDDSIASTYAEIDQTEEL